MQQRPAWTKPEFEEINLSSEIGSYFEEEDPSPFLRGGSPTRRVPAAPARHAHDQGAMMDERPAS